MKEAIHRLGAWCADLIESAVAAIGGSQILQDLIPIVIVFGGFVLFVWVLVLIGVELLLISKEKWTKWRRPHE